MQMPTTYGAEIEKPVLKIKGESHKVSQKYFIKLAEQAKVRGTYLSLHKSDIKPDTVLGVVSTDLGEQGLDNGFNLLESSINYTHSLTSLHERLMLDIKSTQAALYSEEASVINMAILPTAKRDFATYKDFVAPKGVYPYIWYRGWDHTAGIDGRAQNSPSTGVDPEEAADAVSVIIGAGAAFIALFANSPYEEGKRSKFKESRTQMWPRMMRHAKVSGDRTRAMFPPTRFRTMAEYFSWMFGRGTGIHFVLANQNQTAGHTDYKGIGERLLIIQGNPSLLTYLSKKEWQGFFLKQVQFGFPPNQVERVVPKIADMELLQFTQFAGARIRYGLKHEGFPVQEFVEACNRTHKKDVEEIFKKWANFTYIEGRDAGANFPDKELYESGSDIAETTIIGPSVIQA